METRASKVWLVAAAVVVGCVAAAIPSLLSRASAPSVVGSVRMAPAVGMPGAPPTSIEGLQQRITEMERRLREQPGDAAASVLLADALLRQQRATVDGRAANRAASILEDVLKREPGQYDALRLLGAVRLSRHQFRDALDIGRRARDARPDDAWNYGVIGDALLELGEYDDAYDAFDRMAALRPNADAYARISYARELRGDIAGALTVMQMAANATPAHDVEAKAWYVAHVGELYLQLVKPDDAEREFRHATFYFPDYPHAMIGLAKLKVARGDRSGAREDFLAQFKRTPTLDLAARIGDLFRAEGDAGQAERYYQLAEELAGPAIAQTEPAFAMFLAERDRKLPEALRIAESVSAIRHDIFTDDALGWALYKAGRIPAACAAARRALRTGSGDPRIREHAAASCQRAATGHPST
jgi:tetratricopeptide (TPR) repeat protein